MKRIDKLMLSSFVGPFIVAFGVALFVLIMQFLWLYIDEIAGKGVSILVLLELIGYLSISTFPMALPIAVLIASVMVLGNLSERYELSSMKSAGVSLVRVMRSLIFCAAGIALFSYICADFIIPIANLNFKSRLFDIRRQKPALTIEKGVFNEDFRQFIIRVGDKERDGETISNVLIEDQSNVGRTKFNQILADSGQMFTTADKRFFVMNLFKGTQYQEPGSQSPRSNQKYPFVRTNFKSWSKVWDMREFEMTATDKDRFATGRTQMSMNQLRQAIDSMGRLIQGHKQTLFEDLMLVVRRQPIKPKAEPQPTLTTVKPVAASPTRKKPKKGIHIARESIVPPPPAHPSAIPPRLVQVMDKPVGQYAYFDETFKPEDRPSLMREARNRARSALTLLESRESMINSRSKELVKTGYELYTKYSFALVCFFFVFIGAPMGAIIRKGGFGYPILVSIIFFVIFIVLSIMSRKLAELYIMTPFWAAMVPCLTMVPIGAYLTWKAMNDASMFSMDRLDRLVFRLRNQWKKRQSADAPAST